MRFNRNQNELTASNGFLNVLIMKSYHRYDSFTHKCSHTCVQVFQTWAGHEKCSFNEITDHKRLSDFVLDLCFDPVHLLDYD